MNNLFFSSSNDVRSSQAIKSENKLNLKKIKTNTIKSLNEVEYFLNDFKRFSNYIKLYKILK